MNKILGMGTFAVASSSSTHTMKPFLSPSTSPSLSVGGGGDTFHHAGGGLHHSHNHRGDGRDRGQPSLPPRPQVPPGTSPVGRTPHPHDVLCGRGGRINSHPGNVRFRALVDAHKRTYLDPRTKKADKAQIAARIVADVRALAPAGRFLREDPHTGLWVEIGDERAWKKAGQALRESAPEIRAARQALLFRRAEVAPADDLAPSSRHRAPGSGGGGGVRRPADPPGPKHRPSPSAREGLAVPRRDDSGAHRGHDDRGGRSHGPPPLQTQSPPLQTQLSAVEEDMELAQMRREFLQLQRLQQEQQRRMLQYQEQLAAQQRQLGGHADDRDHGSGDPVFDEYLRMVRAQLAAQQARGAMSSSYSPQQQQQQQQQQQSPPQSLEKIAAAIADDGLLPISAGFDVPALRGGTGEGLQSLPDRQEPLNINSFDQYSHNAIQEAFHGQRFHACGADDKTVNTLSSLDVHSMDMSSLGGFDWNTSQVSALTGASDDRGGRNAAGGRGARVRGSRGEGGAAAPTALERKLETKAAAPRPEGERTPAPPRREAASGRGAAAADPSTTKAKTTTPAKVPASRRLSGASGLKSSLSSFGFDVIEEDELCDFRNSADFRSSNFRLSQLGLSNMSEMDLSFNDSVTGAPRGKDNARHGEGAGKIRGGRADAEKRLLAQTLAGDNSAAAAQKDRNAAAHNLSMEDFSTSFRSMDMEDRSAPPPQKPRRRSTVDSMGISDPELLLSGNMNSLRDFDASLDMLRSLNDGSCLSNQCNSNDIFAVGGDSRGRDGEEDQANAGDISALKMVMATGGDA